MRTLKVLGFLLTYPTLAHKEAAQECRTILKKEGWLSSATLEKMDAVISHLETSDILDLQEEYVALFDRTPSLSLHLFEHVHGDSRDRGQALSDLLKVYEEAGLFINGAETPDYLPMFAEYVSTLPVDQASETLGSIVNILSSLSGRLKNREAIYTAIFDALIEASSRTPDKKLVDETLKVDSGKALTGEQMDSQWEEQFAFHTGADAVGQSSGCPKAEEMLARINGFSKEDERV